MVGRPPAGYDSDVHPVLAEQYAREGCINKEIAARLGICETTLYTWRREHEEFRKALKEGKEVTDAKVERALLSRAIGHEYTEKKVIKDEKENVVREEETDKVVLPDVQACRLWLLNRRPDRWRDTQRMEVTGADGGPLEVHAMSDEEIERRAREILAKRSGNTE